MTTSMAQTQAHRRARRLVDRHFAGRIRPDDEHELHTHLLECPPCARYYQLKSFCNRIDPRGTPSTELLARGLGLRGRPAATWGGALVALVALAPAAALAVVLWAVPSTKSERPFVARGAGATDAVRMLVYRLRADAPARRLGGEMSAADELAFSYQNAAGHERLLIFGVDDRKEVFWYYPAWTDPAKAPEAVRIRPGGEAKELGEGIRHRLRPGPLHIVGVFTSRPYTVTDVERALERWNPRGATPLLPESVQVVERVNVVP